MLVLWFAVIELLRREASVVCLGVCAFILAVVSALRDQVGVVDDEV
jgi:hypothetical protein